MLAALPIHRRTRSCSPRSSTPPPSSLKRAESSNDLTAALHLIGLGDIGGDVEGFKSPPTTALSCDINILVNAGQKRSEASRPRHARKFSLQKRKKALTTISERLEKPNLKHKRARSSDGLERGRPGSGSYTILPSSSLVDSSPFTVEGISSTVDTPSHTSASSLPVSPSTLLKSPSCIGILEADETLPSGYKSLGAISATVSPTLLHSQDPASMFLLQAEKLDRRLRSEAIKLGATTLANSTIISVDESGAMAASGIALIVTESEV